MPIKNSISILKNEMTEWRRAFHQNPGTAYEETFAHNFIVEKLKEWDIPYKNGYAKTGLVARIEGQSTRSGRTIGLRADMDALNMTEKTGLPHASRNEGKMHACGHDGHMAALLGTAKYLKENNEFDGTVHLIFQPAEEGAHGAATMITDGVLKDFPCDYIYGAHNWPGLPMGQMGTRVGPLLAAVDEFDIHINGKGGHAAMPENTIDPVPVVAALVSALQTIVSRNTAAHDTAVLSLTNMHAGSGAYNVIPDTGSLSGTVRTFSPEVRKQIKKRLFEVSEGIAESYGASVEISYMEMLEPTINEETSTEKALGAARKVLGDDAVTDDFPASMGGEDFGAFLVERPGAFMIIGQGLPDQQDSPHNQGLHSPFYDFNDEILPIMVSYFTQLVEDHLSHSAE